MTNASGQLAALADPTRRRILERLRSGERSVAEIARGMPVTRPAVSQHLKILKSARLVSDRAEGTRRVYRIDPSGIAALRAWLDHLWESALQALAQEVAKAESEPP